jgi:periplasmic protein TonB
MKEFLLKARTIYLFRTTVLFSIFLHFSVYGSYLISQLISLDEVDSSSITESEIDLQEIPPELIGGTSSPAPVIANDWVEGSNKNAEDPSNEDINVNAVSGNGTDKDGYLFSFNGDKTPTPILDTDLSKFFPPAAKAAGISKKEVIVLIQVDENGKLQSAKIVSGKAGYGFDEAAITVTNMARYSPGYVKGKPVKMAHRMPLVFTLPDEE